MDNEALRRPVVAGLRVTEIEQDAPAATELPHVLFSPKSEAFVPVMVIPVIPTAEVPLFVNLVTIGEVVTPTVAFPKLSASGQAWSPVTNLATNAAAFVPQLLHVESNTRGVVGKFGEKVLPTK